jgi:hypothetical protein
VSLHYEPKERCGCEDRDCRMCHPRMSKREQLKHDDDYGDWLYERAKQKQLNEEKEP